MADGPGDVPSINNFIRENVEKVISSSSPPIQHTFQNFGQGKTVHGFLGGGKIADVLLWKEKHLSAALFIGTTVVWVLFHWLQYTLLSVTLNLLLFALVISFGWSNAARLLNRAPPPIPQLHLSEERVRHVAKTLHSETEKVLTFFHDVAMGKDVVMFLKVSVTLWILSIVGGWFNLLTLVYIVIVGGLTVPIVYDKYEGEINKYSKILLDEAKKQYKKIDELVLSKIPRASNKDKKAQ